MTLQSRKNVKVMVCVFVERCPKLLSFNDQELDKVGASCASLEPRRGGGGKGYFPPPPRLGSWLIMCMKSFLVTKLCPEKIPQAVCM